MGILAFAGWARVQGVALLSDNGESAGTEAPAPAPVVEAMDVDDTEFRPPLLLLQSEWRVAAVRVGLLDRGQAAAGASLNSSSAVLAVALVDARSNTTLLELREAASVGEQRWLDVPTDVPANTLVGVQAADASLADSLLLSSVVVERVAGALEASGPRLADQTSIGMPNVETQMTFEAGRNGTLQRVFGNRTLPTVRILMFAEIDFVCLVLVDSSFDEIANCMFFFNKKVATTKCNHWSTGITDYVDLFCYWPCTDWWWCFRCGEATQRHGRRRRGKSRRSF